MEILRIGRYTTVLVHDEPEAGNARHQYTVNNNTVPVEIGNTSPVLTQINFQNGPIQEDGVNGCQNEDLLAVVIDRLQGFQAGDFACRENAIALTKIQEALMWLDKRTDDRISRGVEGKSMK